MDNKHFPINLQLFAEPGGDQTATPQSTTQQTQQTPKTDAEAFAAALLAAVQAATAKKETAVTKSMAQQYGFSDEEAEAILKKTKEENAKKLPDEVQAVIAAQLEKANGLLIAAEIKAQGATLGLIDPDAALALLPEADRGKIKVDDKGAVTGVKDALEALKKTKPYLFGQTQRAWGDKHGGPPANTDGVEAAFLRKNPGLKVDD